MVVSVAVAVFSVKQWCDLEIQVRVRSRSLEIGLSSLNEKKIQILIT